MSILIRERLNNQTQFIVEGARGRTRTCDLPVISRVLQPTKLPAQRQVADLPSHHKDDGTDYSSYSTSGSLACRYDGRLSNLSNVLDKTTSSNLSLVLANAVIGILIVAPTPCCI